MKITNRNNRLPLDYFNPFSFMKKLSTLLHDPSSLKADVNDNTPKFTKEVFTGGVTTESTFGTVFMNVKVSASRNC